MMFENYLPDLSAAFAAGLFSSLHCAGMCGPLVSLGGKAGAAHSGMSSSILFVTGKFLSYSVLGILAGFLGAAVVGTDLFGKAAAWGALGGGILMLVILAFSRWGIRLDQTAQLSAFLARFSFRTGRWAPFFLGIAAAFLPCGLLYAMVARSAAAGEPLYSMGLLQAFGLGTTPALLGVGTLLRWIPQRWSRWGTVAGEAILALTAIALIWRGVAGLFSMSTGHSCCH
jgi:uncharacterized protein